MESQKNISVSESIKLRSHFKTIERQSFISNFGFKNTFWISFIFLPRLVNVGVFTSQPPADSSYRSKEHRSPNKIFNFKRAAKGEAAGLNFSQKIMVVQEVAIIESQRASQLANQPVVHVPYLLALHGIMMHTRTGGGCRCRCRLSYSQLATAKCIQLLVLPTLLASTSHNALQKYSLGSCQG